MGIVQDAIRPDGGLSSTDPYIDWATGQEQVTLDSAFTAKELREIADVMDTNFISTIRTAVIEECAQIADLKMRVVKNKGFGDEGERREAIGYNTASLTIAATIRSLKEKDSAEQKEGE